MKSIIFDAGPVISLTTNSLLWLLGPLGKTFEGAFYITKAVKKELVDTPICGKKFKFEALQVMGLISDDILQVIHNDQILAKTNHLLEIANTIFKARGNWIKLVHYAEIEVIAAALFLNAGCIVIDERTTRSLIETPEKLKRHLEKKLHTAIQVNEKNLAEFQKQVRGIEVIRSVELVTIAFELGLLNHYLVDKDDK
ncbi:hypothetical protein COT47_07470, partial [Candidatus Woesearchaeota archaeon CG08_land_8_20_14_0_20_43_7]